MVLNMIVDQNAESTFATRALQSQEPAIVAAIEQGIENVVPFGPARSVRRRYLAESSEYLGDARRYRDSQEECHRVMFELGQVCEATQEREAWWRRGVESMELNVSEREHERNRLLETSQREWTTRYAELQSTAAAASHQIQNQHSLIEAQAARLHHIESVAEEELTSLPAGLSPLAV